jgi:hypothetical protein
MSEIISNIEKIINLLKENKCDDILKMEIEKQIMPTLKECTQQDNMESILKQIRYDELPKESQEDHQENIPYTKGPFKTSPLLHYLEENQYYDSHASGNYDDFGYLTKPIFGIPADRFVCIKSIDSVDFKISWIVENVDEQMLELMNYTDYDWRVFDKLGFTTKTKNITIKFLVSDEIVEEK